MEFNLDTWRTDRTKARRADDDKIDQLCDIALAGQVRIKELEAIVDTLSKKITPDNAIQFPPAESAAQ